ncbi:MAG: amidohydrolase family protein [Candidatus Rokubacteria bacterium]|nr:amidohydrolase family protein [Candidatus Rokubacteria bacterium]MBI3825820.1 amidohydrolase family protein [Candidatus Rokubacteria bacterium]
MLRRSALALGVALAVTTAFGAPGAARGQLPIFDAHIHYSRPDWDAYTPERALSILARAGVHRALVSSTPDDGTLELYRRAPKAIVPFLRPYRTSEDRHDGWTRNPQVAAHVEQRLQRGVHRGIGEIHLSVDEAGDPVVRRIAALAAEGGLFVQVHVDQTALERLLTLYPKVRLLWAHAGMSASAETVGRLLDRHPMLWVELALRSDVADGARLDPVWRALFLKHPDRFLVGTDTFTTSRWESVAASVAAVQAWLTDLPRAVAEQIAFKNGDRLFPPP